MEGGVRAEKSIYWRAWRPQDKMKVEQRERKARAAKAQARKEFVKKMEQAEAMAREMYNNKDPSAPGAAMEFKFIDWAVSRYQELKFEQAMSKAEQEMRATWGEIVRTAAACAKATEARVGAKRRERQKKAAAAWRARRGSGKLGAEEAESV